MKTLQNELQPCSRESRSKAFAVTLFKIVLLVTAGTDLAFGDEAMAKRRFVTNSRLLLGTETNLSASVRCGDVNADGRFDVIIANGRHWPQQNFVFLNQGRAIFNVMRPLGHDRCTSYACELSDLDGDGDLDIATGNAMAPCNIFLNNGNGGFKFHTTLGDISSVRSLTLADIDKDSDIDVLATSRGRPNRIYLNDGNANFPTSVAFGSKRDSTIDVAVADMDNDGDNDLLLANRDHQKNSVLLNDGKLKFTERLAFGDSADQTRAVVVADFNNDGNLDCATGNIGNTNIIYLGNGDGRLKPAVKLGNKSERTYSMVVGDLNQDGLADIVAGNVMEQNTVFLNCGTGKDRGLRFEPIAFGDKSTSTYGLCVGDFDSDGFQDIAVANSDAKNRIFLNRPAEPASDATSRSPQSPAKPKSPVKAQSSGTPTAPSLNNEASSSAATPAVIPSTDWPSFRGAGGNGIVKDYEVRTTWNADITSEKPEGVLWQVDVPGLGHSSPVIVGDKLLLATAIAENGESPLTLKAGGARTAADDNGEQSWVVLCYDKNTGTELWRRVARKGMPRATRHAKATHANTSVCVANGRIIAFFGSEGLYCYDLDGQLKWSQDLGVINISKYGVGWGYASSPAVHDGSIVLICDDPDDPYLSALRLSDGKETWRVSRDGDSVRNWSTPLIHTDGAETQVVINGWPAIVSYDLASGNERWRIEGGGDNPVPTPFVSNGWFYITSAHGAQSPIYVVRPDARGDITPDSKSVKNDSSPIVWSTKRGGSYMSTPIVVADHLYLGNSNGIVRCFGATSGEKVYERRLPKGAGIIASLVSDNKRIFCASEDGNVYVLDAGPEFNVVATNPMGDPILASPAISAGVLYVRTIKRLVAIK